MDNPLFDYSAIVDRAHRPFPGGARVAVWVGVNVEHYQYGKPALSLVEETKTLVPDSLNYGWRDYGVRVGIFRLVEGLARIGVRGSALVNTEVLTRYRPVVSAIADAGWCWVAHGRDNSTLQTGMPVDVERQYLREVTEEFTAGLGRRPNGWLGPVRASSHHTNALLADLGYRYALDWGNDDQVYPFTVPSGELLSIPYSIEINDIVAYGIHGYTGPQFRGAILDHVETLSEQGDRWPSVLGLSIHPFLSGQPARLRHLVEALREIAAAGSVWMTTSDEIADWYAGL